MGSLRVKFWGTRGLFSSPRLETAGHGGNTPCLQILHGQHLILVDSGFGCSNLGDELMTAIVRDKIPMTIHIFYTHFHWDHIQGLPFFKPIYFPSTTLHLYSPCETASTLDNLNILFDGSYSPFESLLSMQAKVHLHKLTGPMHLEGLEVSFCPVDHGQDAANLTAEETYAYKFKDETSGESVCLITDHEARPSARNRALIKWAKDCDLLIHDGQYSHDEYDQVVGWGHSSMRQALDNAARINSKMTLLTHHDPRRDDKDLSKLFQSLARLKKYRHLPFAFAQEEIVYEVSLRKVLPSAG